MGESDTRRLLLRAELIRSGRNIVAHTLEIAETWAFVRTDETLFPGEQVSVRLSFPKLLEPLELDGHVVSKRFAAEAGQLAGYTLGFVFHSEAQREQLAAVLKRADEGTAGEARAYRVLLVEDNQVIREMFAYGVRKYFAQRQSNVVVDLAADGEQAWLLLEARAEGDYDLAIVDYYLPTMHGGDLLTRMRADARYAQMPVVAISSGGEEVRKACLSAGADMFLDKPIVLKDLFSTLERLAPSS